MEQILAHMWGDYIIQSTWMANNKTKPTLIGWLACLVHCITYTLPFVLITQNPIQLLLIFGTHFPIDKFRLARYINQVKNWAWTPTGLPDSVPPYSDMLDHINRVKISAPWNYGLNLNMSIAWDWMRVNLSLYQNAILDMHHSLLQRVVSLYRNRLYGKYSTLGKTFYNKYPVFTLKINHGMVFAV